MVSAPAQAALLPRNGVFDPVEWASGAERFVQRLRTDLNTPLLTCSATELAQLFELFDCMVTVRRPPDFQDHPELALRIRGAVGRVLAMMGPPVSHRRDVGSRARAWTAVFESLGRLSNGEEIQKPFMIHTDSERDTIRITARLVGMAGFWLPDIEAAMVGALEGGISLWENSRQRVPIEILAVERRCRTIFDPPAFAARSARLTFLTPLRLRHGKNNVFSPQSMLVSLVNRIERMARWQAIRLEIDWPEIHRRAHALTYDTDGTYPYAWRRGSQRADGKLDMVGLLGPALIDGPLSPFVPYLQIGEAINTGSHAALGLGRYRLALFPD